MGGYLEEFELDPHIRVRSFDWIAVFMRTTGTRLSPADAARRLDKMRAIFEGDHWMFGEPTELTQPRLLKKYFCVSSPPPTADASVAAAAPPGELESN